MALRKIISFIFPQGTNLTVSFAASLKDSFNLDLLHFFDFNDQQSLLKEVFFIPQEIVWQIMETRIRGVVACTRCLIHLKLRFIANREKLDDT